MSADDELGAAYERMARALVPPQDARDRIADGVRARRRRRTGGGAALAVLVVLGLGGYAVAQGGGDPERRRPPVASDPTGTAEPEGPRISCAGGADPAVFPSLGSWNYRGADLPEDVAAAWRDEQSGDRLVLDSTGPDRLRATVVAADGTTRVLADLRERSTGWWPEALRICPEQWPGGGGQVVTLVVGHCYVEPVSFDGWLWGLAKEDQFGGGGLAPQGLAGSGTVAPRGDRLRYVDVSGVRLTLVRSDDPRFFDPLTAPCY